MELIVGAESSIPAVVVWDRDITSPTDSSTENGISRQSARLGHYGEVMRTLTVLYIDNWGERNICVRIVKRGDVGTKDVLRVK
jgi:hypothetical protein